MLQVRCQKLPHVKAGVTGGNLGMQAMAMSAMGTAEKTEGMGGPLEMTRTGLERMMGRSEGAADTPMGGALKMVVGMAGGTGGSRGQV
jgi:hypothetical protein